MQNRFRGRGIACLAILIALIAPASLAQTAVDGAVGGTVVDASAPSSAAPPSLFTITEPTQSKLPKRMMRVFRLIHLQPGSYTVTVTASGFEPYKAVDVVQVGLLTTIDAHMQVGSTSQTVEVTGATPLVNTTNPDFAGIIDQKILHDLPVSNYRWSSYALFTPGVVNDSNGYGLLSFRGQSTLLNNVTIDGTDENQAFFSEERGRTRAGDPTAKEAVQEFQVNTSNYSVEYGRSAGGIVKLGHQERHQQLPWRGLLFRPRQRLGRNQQHVTHPVEVSDTPPTYRWFHSNQPIFRRQYGLAVGGPIWKDKVFFFFAADQVLSRLSGRGDHHGRHREL